MTHPSAIDLEAFACGEPAARVASHVDGCAACRAFIAKAQGLSPRIAVAPVVAAARGPEKRRRLFLASSVAAPLAIAAAAILFMRSPSRDEQPVAAIDPPAPKATTSYTTLEYRRDPDTTFKGGAQIAVVRERAGAQDRFTGDLRVKPGDRLRIEVALDRPVAILGAVMGDDGSWIELMPEQVRDAGTHFSEKSVRIDEAAMSGTISVGPPDAVRRAHATQKLDGVRSIRLEWEAP